MNWIEPDWPAPTNVHGATTLRTGGVSSGAYQSLNPAGHVNDDIENVRVNRQRIKQMLNLPNEPVWLRQVHGARVVNANQVDGVAQADASYSDRPGIVCAVLTADCLPLLFTTDDGRRIAAAHAGWRGLLSGIIERTVEMMADSESLVWMGPAIGAQCFEVGDDVRQAFVHKSAEFAHAFREHAEHKWLADIYRLARITLARQGVNRIYGGDFCTVTESERFYSYRRDGETGRMATLIWRD
ncbi:peptidoglycan editing factor PgeF [Methylomarinum sp. Ch1-1]|uniref:Purine nucleoside phosphorylase n=1 Tax=Methylomarinum roseum TaxID=3067653 RepID=A0AAU7NX43_9GAMM|nr:peptidoglycan editing factor PgeF [Methylomarinum sp. Ch1-1]MDP4522416.1 peptidoglycan editing factor PgeF [Methylomarinum sp. Ch1-1]